MTQTIANVKELTALRNAVRAEKAKLSAEGHKQIRICMGASCIASGARKVRAALEKELVDRQMQQRVSIVGTGCLGPCSGGPVLMIDDVFYEKLRPQDAKEIVTEHLGRGRVVERLSHKRPDGRAVANAVDMDSSSVEEDRVGNCDLVDPRIEDYIARDGYQALANVLTRNDAEMVIETMRVSGLRGRGGAGFPTWRKWKFTREAAGEKKFVVCNADEGDPGAFMDRSVLEGDPHSVIEGMVIAAHTVGARMGYIYVRAEYPLAVERLKIALAQAKDRGLLGQNILGAHFDFDVEIRMGSGAFVCGEETALLTSIEGNRGEPRPRPPFPAVQGLWGKPTVLNNVETYANVPAIVLGGPCYAAHGTERIRARRSSPWPARQNSGLSRCPSACRYDLITTSAAAFPAARSSRRRIGSLRGASLSSTSTCRWITSRSPSWGRSWAPAA